MILRDGNNTIYPIAKDCAEAIRDPNWLDLVPVLCIGASTIPIPSCTNSSNLKNQVAVIALVFDNLLLLPRILRCDFDGVKQVFVNLEQDQSKFDTLESVGIRIGQMFTILFDLLENISSQIQTVLAERCDGNRNILHACVNMCSPTSNKENEQGGKSIVNLNHEKWERSKNFNSFLGIERELVANTVDGNTAPIEEPIPTLSWPPEAFDNTSGEEDSLLSIGAASISMMNKSGHFHIQFRLKKILSLFNFIRSGL